MYYNTYNSSDHTAELSISPSEFWLINKNHFITIVLEKKKQNSLKLCDLLPKHVNSVVCSMLV